MLSDWRLVPTHDRRTRSRPMPRLRAIQRADCPRLPAIVSVAPGGAGCTYLVVASGPITWWWGSTHHLVADKFSLQPRPEVTHAPREVDESPSRSPRG
jgi:hypothetical protein